MRFPTKLQDLVPPESVRQFLELVNQPTLVSGLKEAAQKMGWKESWQPPQFHEAMQQAKKWLNTLAYPFHVEGLSVQTCINGTGEIFSERWLGLPLDSEALRAQAMISEGFSTGNIAQATVASLKKLYKAEEAIVVSSVGQAIDLVARHPDFRGQWCIPRVDCIRLPRQNNSNHAVDVRDMLSFSQSTIQEIGASNECDRADFERVLQQGHRAVLTCWPSGLDLTNPWSPHRDWAIDVSHPQQGIAAELLLLGATYPIGDSSLQPPMIVDRLHRGADIVILPGDGLLGGPACGILVGTAKALHPLQAVVDRFGLRADASTLAALATTIERSKTEEQWKQTPLGAILTNSLANLEHRAQRIVAQLRGSPLLNHVDLETKSVSFGSAPWNLLGAPSPILRLQPSDGDVELLASKLFHRSPPILGRIVDGHLEFVLRTVSSADDAQLGEAFWSCEEEPKQGH